LRIQLGLPAVEFCLTLVCQLDPGLYVREVLCPYRYRLIEFLVAFRPLPLGVLPGLFTLILGFGVFGAGLAQLVLDVLVHFKLD
jgi:hypothetical protein